MWEKFPGLPELLTSEYAIKVYGQGHVVAHNYMAHWHDAIDVATYGEPDGAPTRSRTGCRFRSTSTATTSSTWATTASNQTAAPTTSACSATAASTSASQGLSAQPMYGAGLLLPEPRLQRAGRADVQVRRHTGRGADYQNTFVGEASQAHRRRNVNHLNNLILSAKESSPVFVVGTYTSDSTSDYTSFRPNPGRTTRSCGTRRQQASRPMTSGGGRQSIKTLGEYSGDGAGASQCHGGLRRLRTRDDAGQD